MVSFSCFKDQHVAVFGLGLSGLAAALALLEGGAFPVCWDDNPVSREAAVSMGLKTHDLHHEDWSCFAALVLSPGVPLDFPSPHWAVSLARAAGVAIIGDIELFVRERQCICPQAPFIAVTGTNGKSTTTALIGHILDTAGCKVQAGGNIGAAVGSFVSLSADCHYVIECSSFQIELTPSLDPDIGVLLNITPDHLDRHGSMEHYAAIKELVVKRAGCAVISPEDSFCADIAGRLEKSGHERILISSCFSEEQGYHAQGKKLFYRERDDLREVFSLTDSPVLRGRHNCQNALAAVAVCMKMGLDLSQIQAGLRSFTGLAHRMEIVGRKRHVLFINDSKSTNAVSAAAALSTFSRIYWIAGGQPKEGGIESLRPFFPHVARAYIIGEAAASFPLAFSGGVPFEISETLSVALEHATRDAERDDAEEVVVLFSPACASFDQFTNFEERGDVFRCAVNRFEGVEPVGLTKEKGRGRS